MSLVPQPRSCLLSYRAVLADRNGDNPGDKRPCWAALATVLGDAASSLVDGGMDLRCLEDEIEAVVTAHEVNVTLTWDGKALVLSFDPSTTLLPVTLYSRKAVVTSRLILSALTIKCGETTFSDVTGSPLDILSLAELFVQLFSLDLDKGALLEAATEAREIGLTEEAFTVAEAVAVWERVEESVRLRKAWKTRRLARTANPVKWGK